MFNLSRSLLASSFGRQYSSLERGTCPCLQALWQCQKQPFTKMIFRERGKTRSGLPGSRLLWSLYRDLNPNRHTIRLTTISGEVSLHRIRRMFRLRCSGETLSTGVSHCFSFFFLAFRIRCQVNCFLDGRRHYPHGR